MEKKSIKDLLHDFAEKAKENREREGRPHSEGKTKLSEILENLKKGHENVASKKRSSQKLSEILEKIKQRKAESENTEEANNESQD